MMRRPLALLLLLAQALALLHLVVAAHTLGDSGMAVEAPPECSRPRHAGSGVEHGHPAASADTECLALACLRSGVRPPPVATAPAGAACNAVVALSSPAAHWAIELLSVAPKGSPPA